MKEGGTLAGKQSGGTSLATWARGRRQEVEDRKRQAGILKTERLKRT
jgi:hypothetical protein